MTTANAIQQLSNRVWQAAQERAAQTPTLPSIHQPRLRLKLIQIAYEDTAYLATLHLANHAISRAACHAVGIKEMRWLRARALFKLAGLLDDHEHALNTDDPDRIKKHLETAYKIAIETPNRFFAYMPPRKRRLSVRP